MAIIGEEYKSEKLPDGTFAIYDVPIFAETVDDRDSFDVCDYDRETLKKIVARHKELEKTGHCKPIHLGHHEGQENKRNLGFISNLRIKDVDGIATVFADLIRIPEDIYKDLCDGRIPYRSVEIDLDDEHPCFSSLSLLSTQDPYFEFPNMNVKSVVFGRSGKNLVKFCRMPHRKVRVIFDFRNQERKNMRRRRYGTRKRKFMERDEYYYWNEYGPDNGIYLKIGEDYDERAGLKYILAKGENGEGKKIYVYPDANLLEGPFYSYDQAWEYMQDVGEEHMMESYSKCNRRFRHRSKYQDESLENGYSEEDLLLKCIEILEHCRFDLQAAIEDLSQMTGADFEEARDLIVQAIDLIGKSRELLEAVRSSGMSAEFRKAKRACRLFNKRGSNHMRKRRHSKGRRRRFMEGDTTTATTENAVSAAPAETQVEKSMTVDMSDYVTSDEFAELSGKVDDLAGMVADLTGKIDEILAGKPQEPAPPVAEDTQQEAPKEGEKAQMSKRSLHDRVRQLEIFAKNQENTRQVDNLIVELRKSGAVFNEQEVRSTAAQFAKIGQKAFKRYANSLLVNSSGPIHTSGLNIGVDDLATKYSKDPEVYQAARMADKYFSKNQRELSASGITRSAWIEGEVIKFKRNRKNGRNRNL